MPQPRRKVVIRLSTGGLFWGYLPLGGFVTEGRVEAIDPAGRIFSCALNEIQTIAYVRDFHLEDAIDPERMGRRSFAARPRGEGAWVRMTFADDSQLEGLASFDLGLLDAAREDGGLYVTPPDARGNTLRVFVPRSALKSIELLGAVLPHAARPVRRKPSAEDQQESLFER